MAQAVETDEQVARFRAEVLPRLVERFGPERVLVFGSRARGAASPHSDLDVVVVSSAFGGVRWLERAVRVYQTCDIRLDVELLCYTPEEYARKVEELGIVRVATLEGVDLLRGPPLRVAEPGRVEPARGRWRAQAERDLANARKNVAIGAYEVAAFLAHQAVAKRLKAAWIGRRWEVPPHTHSLQGLSEGLGVPAELRGHLEDLDRDNVGARYPDAAAGVPCQVYDRPKRSARWRRRYTAEEYARKKEEFGIDEMRNVECGMDRGAVEPGGRPLGIEPSPSIPHSAFPIPHWGVPVRDTTERTNYVQQIGAIAQIIASTIAIIVLATK